MHFIVAKNIKPFALKSDECNFITVNKRPAVFRSQVLCFGVSHFLMVTDMLHVQVFEGNKTLVIID